MKNTPKKLEANRQALCEEVVSRFEQALLRYATRILNNAVSAQDVVQEAFIRFFEKWDDDLAPSPKMSAWLYRAVHNAAIDYVRRESTRRKHHEKHAEGVEQYVAGEPWVGSINPATEKARRALKVLSQRERDLVVLKIFEEKSYKEISEITGLKVSNVGYILHHAMRKMTEELRKGSE